MAAIINYYLLILLLRTRWFPVVDTRRTAATAAAISHVHTHTIERMLNVYIHECVCVCLVRSVRRPRNVINCTCKQKKRTKTNVLLSFKITRRRTGRDGGNARVHFSASWVLLFCGGACVLLPRKRARGVPCGPSRYISRTVAAAAFFIPGSALPMWRTDVPTECRPVQP